MRLDKLYIHKFKNLEDFCVDFDESSLTTVIVGQNGAGKSNLLEAIVLIFRNLDLGEPPGFAYELDYYTRGRKIHVSADPDRENRQVQVSSDGEIFPRSRYHEVLPNHVFGYYSGPSGRLETHFEAHQEKFYKELLSGNEDAPRPLFYARLIHSQFVLLSFFREEDSVTRDFLRNYFGIKDLESVLFVMREPTWKSNAEGGDPRFWSARGVVADFLAKLYDRALAPMRFMNRVHLGLRKTTNREQLYLFLRDAESLRGLASEFADRHTFFKVLESTYVSDLIAEVRIRVKLGKPGQPLTFRELSEGEQQLLTVLGLLRFTHDEESLFLLDEPDTHLNPAWSIRYLDLLREIVGEEETSHIIISTHDPLLVSSLTRSQVRIMSRDPGVGKIVVSMPEEDPRGMGFAGILTSDLFGLRSSLDLETLRLLDRQRSLLAKDELTEAEENELSALSLEIEGIDASKFVKDPLYPLFVKAMSELDRASSWPESPVLSQEERGKRERMAIEILEEIKGEAGA